MSESQEKWQPPIKKWYNVKKEAYALIYEQAKERLDDILSESESITNKSIKMIIALAAFLGFFIGLVATNKWQIGFLSVFFVLVLVDAVMLFILIAPKYVKWRGLAPKVAMPDNFDAEDDKDFQEEMIYYTSIVVFQENIDFMLKKNGERAILYRWSLIFFLMIFTAIATYIILLL